MKKSKQLFLAPVSTTLWLLILAASVFIVYWARLPWFLTPLFAFGILALHEIFAFCLFGKGLFPSEEKIRRVYQWFNFFLGESGNIQKKGDLTEGYYNGDYSKTLEQATIDKYEEIIRDLKLEKGSRVLDVGCGLGDFLFYLRSKEIEGVGLNISPHQQRSGVDRGLDIRVYDFRKGLPAEFEGQFDAVTFIGCLEHFNVSYLMKNRSAALLVVTHKC